MKKLIILLIILFPSVCISAPSITSGDITGTTITIGGTGFGTKSTAAPLKFDDFSSGTVGNAISNGWGSHPVDDGFSAPEYDNTSPRITGDQFIRCDLGSPKTSSSFYLSSQTTTLSTFYISCYRRVAKVSGTTSTNWKYIYVTSSATSFAGALPRAMDQGNATNYYLTIQDDNASSPGDITTTNTLDQGWARVEFYGTESSGGATADGQVWISTTIDGNTISSRVGDGAVVTRDVDHWINAHFGLYVQNDGSSVYTHDYSDIYFDNSWCVLELGDNATRSSCTKLETQPMTAHSSTAITATLNLGGFSAGNTVYAFVRDDTGVLNTTGYELTIPAGGSTPNTVGVSVNYNSVKIE